MCIAVFCACLLVSASVSLRPCPYVSLPRNSAAFLLASAITSSHIASACASIYMSVLSYATYSSKCIVCACVCVACVCGSRFLSYYGPLSVGLFESPCLDLRCVCPSACAFVCPSGRTVRHLSPPLFTSRSPSLSLSRNIFLHHYLYLTLYFTLCCCRSAACPSLFCPSQCTSSFFSLYFTAFLCELSLSSYVSLSPRLCSIPICFLFLCHCVCLCVLAASDYRAFYLPLSSSCRPSLHIL